jgi:hypothetical protein
VPVAGRQRKTCETCRTSGAGGWRTTEKSATKGEYHRPAGLLLSFRTFTGVNHMRLRTNEEAIKIINSCALEYKKNLSNKHILFITLTDKKAAYFEALFMPQNFKHLTGIISQISGLDFYNLAVRNRLSPTEVALANDGTTDLKLDVLPQLMNIHLTARMVGDYDYSKSLLIADNVAGTVTAAMGFVQTKGVYLPKTALKTDVRDITLQATRRRVVAIFVKERNDDLYKQQTYLAKGVTIDNKPLELILLEKVDMEMFASHVDC